MAGALQLIARLSPAEVPPVPPAKNSGEPLEATPLLVVPPVPSVPPSIHQHPSAYQSDTFGHGIRSAATASPAWLAARDAYINHLMACRCCYAPAARHCQTGATLRADYGRQPWSAQP